MSADFVGNLLDARLSTLSQEPAIGFLVVRKSRASATSHDPPGSCTVAGCSLLVLPCRAACRRLTVRIGLVVRVLIIPLFQRAGGRSGCGMSSHSKSSTRRKVGRIPDVRSMEVECAAPGGTQMVIELEGGLRLLRLLVADDGAVELAARLINALRGARPVTRPGKGGCR